MFWLIFQCFVWFVSMLFIDLFNVLIGFSMFYLIFFNVFIDLFNAFKCSCSMIWLICSMFWLISFLVWFWLIFQRFHWFFIGFIRCFNVLIVFCLMFIWFDRCFSSCHSLYCLFFQRVYCLYSMLYFILNDLELHLQSTWKASVPCKLADLSTRKSILKAPVYTHKPKGTSDSYTF